jgi:hypothetical protein
MIDAELWTAFFVAQLQFKKAALAGLAMVINAQHVKWPHVSDGRFLRYAEYKGDRRINQERNGGNNGFKHVQVISPLKMR